MRKEKITFEDIINLKGKEKIVAITAYDAMFAKIFDDYADIILVGDTLNMNFNNKKDVVSLTLDEMIYHSKAVKSGVKRAMVVFDMPFGSYIDETSALKSAIRACKEAEVDAVKIEGGMNKVNIIKTLNDNGISVMAHIGVLSQHFNKKDELKGISDIDKKILIKEAKLAASAGAFCIVLDSVVADLAGEISKLIHVPVIGFGSGNGVDGELLIFSDMLGLTNIYKQKATKSYLNGEKLVREAMSNFCKDIKKEESLLIAKF